MGLRLEVGTALAALCNARFVVLTLLWCFRPARQGLDDQPALAVVRRLGYRQVGRFKDYILAGADALLMHKRLG